MTHSLLDSWNQDDYQTVEEGVLVARHRLAETGLFTDEALAELIDNHPPENFTVNTMGLDPGVFDWREGDRNGVDGETLIRLVRTGQLWVNCRNVLETQPRYAELVHSLYDEIEENKPGFRAQHRSANILISSPRVWVPYHVDMPVNMLWHIRGKKRVWVYPHFDNRFASPFVLGKVCSGQWTEEVPYDPQFDRYALVYDAEPGQLITWPQLTPHRVENTEGLNVSLSTEHKNARATRRIHVHTANNLLRENWNITSRSIDVDGPLAHAKQLLSRAHNQIRKWRGETKEQYLYPVSFVVDPEMPHGYRILEGFEDGVSAPHLEEQLAEV